MFSHTSKHIFNNLIIWRTWGSNQSVGCVGCHYISMPFSFPLEVSSCLVRLYLQESFVVWVEGVTLQTWLAFTSTREWLDGHRFFHSFYGFGFTELPKKYVFEPEIQLRANLRSHLLGGEETWRTGWLSCWQCIDFASVLSCHCSIAL